MNETARPVHSRRRFSPAWPVKNLPAGAEALIPELDNPRFEGIEDPTDNTESITGTGRPSPQHTAPETDPKPKAVWRFFVYSAIGIFAFFVPFTIGDSKSTILLDHIVSWITTTLGEGTRYLALFAIIAGTVYQFVSGRWKEDYPRMAFAALSVLAIVLCARCSPSASARRGCSTRISARSSWTSWSSPWACSSRSAQSSSACWSASV